MCIIISSVLQSSLDMLIYCDCFRVSLSCLHLETLIDRINGTGLWLIKEFITSLCCRLVAHLEFAQLLALFCCLIKIAVCLFSNTRRGIQSIPAFVWFWSHALDLNFLIEFLCKNDDFDHHAGCLKTQPVSFSLLIWSSVYASSFFLIMHSLNV